MAKSSVTSARTAATIVLVATIATIAVNVASAAGFINGISPDVVSARYPTVVTPAGYAFSIWSLIYVGMIAFSVYQFIPVKGERFASIRTPYVLSCALNCGWIFAWHYELLGLCLLLIIGLLATLLWICLKVRHTGSFVTSLVSKAPFGLYFGWVTAATLVNQAIFLGSRGADAQNNILGIGMIVTATVCAFIVRWRLTNYFYPLAVAWALTAIAVKQSGNTAIVLAAAFGTVTCLVTAGSVVTALKDSTSEQR